MATPGELVHIVAHVLGISEATVVQHDRNLTAGGLRTKGGRGPSAAHVTSLDAANLLIAICGAPISGASVKETLTTCNRYGSLQAYNGGKLGAFSNVKSQLPTLGKLHHGHSFRDAISALIESLAAGEFHFAGRRSGTVSVSFRGPEPSGIISVQVRRKALLIYRENANPFHSDKDLEQERWFTIKTLSEIARIVGRRGAIADQEKGGTEASATFTGKPLG